MNQPGNRWIIGARTKTLPAAIAPVLVAVAIAYPEFNLVNALLALTVGLALQIAVNYANDYSDGVRGTDEERIGPTRLVASGLASAAEVKQAAFVAFGIGAIAGLYLATRTSLWFIAIGLAAIAKEINIACLTDLAEARPLPTNLTGPTRLLSVPRIPSL